VATEITLWFVPLAEVSQPEGLAAAIVEIVGGAALWPGSGPNSALERLLPSLQEKARPVLVLDNIEHLLPTATALVQTLLQRAPALRILGTSRHSLQIAGEAVLEVPLMPVPLPDTPPEKLLDWECIQLFQTGHVWCVPAFKFPGTMRPPLPACASGWKAGLWLLSFVRLTLPNLRPGKCCSAWNIVSTF
jgi:predicted ATPase